MGRGLRLATNMPLLAEFSHDARGGRGYRHATPDGVLSQRPVRRSEAADGAESVSVKAGSFEDGCAAVIAQRGAVDTFTAGDKAVFAGSIDAEAHAHEVDPGAVIGAGVKENQVARQQRRKFGCLDSGVGNNDYAWRGGADFILEKPDLHSVRR